MFAYLRRQRLILPIAPVAGGTIGLLAALVVALLPMRLIEDAATASGLAAVLPAAAPPLGVTARVALLLVVGAGVSAVLWLGIYLLVGNRALLVRPGARSAPGDAPVLRRADAHPDAPARRPLFAAQDLGTPFLQVAAAAQADPPAPDPLPEEAACDLPRDLDEPLAAYDPGAIRPVPAEPVRPVAPLARFARPQVFGAGERLETFPLTPPAPARAAPADRPRDGAATLHELLDRLERGAARRDRPPAPRDAALATLRRLADEAA